MAGEVNALLVDTAGNPVVADNSLNNLTVSRGTGTATLRYIYNPQKNFLLEHIDCRFATTETPNCTFTITASSAGGAAYSGALLYSVAAGNTNAHMFFPTRAIPFGVGDTLFLECSTASNHVWGYSIYTRE